MTDLERDLRKSLAARAAVGAVGTEDLPDLRRRIATRRRHRIGAVVSGFVLVAAVSTTALVMRDSGAGTGSRVATGSTGTSVRGVAPETSVHGTAPNQCGVGVPATAPTTTLPPPAAPPTAAATVASPSTASECEPAELSLPKPGRQPSDPSAARAGVQAAFRSAYDRGLASTDAARSAIQDGDTLAPLAAELHVGPLASLLEQSTVEVRTIVFTSPTSATARYDSYVGTETQGAARLGEALLLGGRWVVSHRSACTDLARIGAVCPGFPPSSSGG
jgi:hypothetical protein